MLETLPPPSVNPGEIFSPTNLDKVISYIREKNSGDEVEIFPGAEKGSTEERANRIIDGLVYTLGEVAEESYEKRHVHRDYGRTLQAAAPMIDFLKLFVEGQLSLEENIRYERKAMHRDGGLVYAYGGRFVSNGMGYLGEILIRPQLGGETKEDKTRPFEKARDQRINFEVTPDRSGDLGKSSVRIDPQDQITYDLVVEPKGLGGINVVDHLDFKGSGQASTHHFRSSEKLQGRGQFREILELLNKKAQEQIVG